MGGRRLDRCSSGWGEVAWSCGNGNKTTGSIKREGFDYRLRTSSFLRKTLLHGAS